MAEVIGELILQVRAWDVGIGRPQELPVWGLGFGFSGLGFASCRRLRRAFTDGHVKLQGVSREVDKETKMQQTAKDQRSRLVQQWETTIAATTKSSNSYGKKYYKMKSGYRLVRTRTTLNPKCLKSYKT